MRLKVFTIVLSGMIALLGTSCGSSKQVATRVSEFHGSSVQEWRDSVRVEQVMVAVHDTIVETTTITIRENEAGDTIFRSVVTDRTRAARREDVAAYRTKTVIKTDTVFVERRDSVLVQSGTTGRARDSPFISGLKWGFWIVIALIGLGIVLRIRT